LHYDSIYDIPEFYQKCNDELYTKHRHTCGDHCLRDGMCRARFPRDIIEKSHMDEKGHFHLCRKNTDTNQPTTIISYCTGTNNDCTHLQSGTSCKGAICYCTDYNSKSPLKMQTTFDTIKAVMTSNLRNSNAEEDSNDNNILGRKLLIKMCNMLTVKMEMGGPMVAHYLLGGKGYYSNIQFKNLYWTQFVNYITEMENFYKIRISSIDDGDEYSVNEDDVSTVMSDSHSDLEQTNHDVEILLDDDEDVVAVSVVSHYTMRGRCMDNINLFDFYSSYEVQDFHSSNIGM